MISIIIPCHNSEQYISETIDSIMNQQETGDMSYEIILVDDGSTDSTLDIILKLQKRNSRIIKVFFQENEGVSSARNYALRHISSDSEIITFIDSDDKVSPNFLSEAKKFFDENPSIGIAVSRIEYFGLIVGHHGLNFRFNASSNIVNIFEEPDFIQFNLGGTFFRREVLCNSKKFDTNLNFWEDALLINTIIIELGKYGLIKKGIYYYRKNQNSLVDNSWKSEERYTKLFDLGYQNLFEMSKKKYDRIIDYIQYAVVYHMKLVFNPVNQSKINNSQININEFIQRVHNILIQVEDYNIINQRYTPEISSALLEIKRKAIIPEKIEKIKGLDYFYLAWDKKKRGFYIQGKVLDSINSISKVKIKYFFFRKKEILISEKDALSLFNKPVVNFFSFNIRLSCFDIFLIKELEYKSKNVHFSQKMYFYKKLLRRVWRNNLK